MGVQLIESQGRMGYGTRVIDKSDCQVATAIAWQGEVRAINLRVMGKPRALSLMVRSDKVLSISKSGVI